MTGNDNENERQLSWKYYHLLYHHAVSITKMIKGGFQQKCKNSLILENILMWFTTLID